jgi:hypothetical protein
MKLKDMQDMYWGHDDRNRFSLLGNTLETVVGAVWWYKQPISHPI